jgi:glycosyltransferase involved in cell wall biosynthesis
MQAHPKISVVLPTYNRLHTLPRAIGSVLAQTEEDFELVVVDDASSDGTQVYLASLTDARIRVIALPRNVGVAGARNAGIDTARADILCFLDSDDAYFPQRLSVVLDALAGAPDIVCTLSSGLVEGDAKPRQIVTMPDVTLTPAALEWALHCAMLSSGGTNITARRGAAQSIGGFRSELRVMEDQDFLARLSRLGGCRLISTMLWKKHRSEDALTARWTDAGSWLLDYARLHPHLVTRYRKLASYLATRVLVGDLRHGSPRTFMRDLRNFKSSGLIDGNILRMWRDHRDVRHYRRTTSLSGLTGPPGAWQ